MTHIVGIDPSLTRAGIATFLGDEIHLRSIGAAGLATDNYDDRRERIELQAYEIGKRVGHPDLIVMEGPSYGSNMPSAFDRAGLFWGLMSTLSRRAPIAIVPPRTRAKYASGNGNSKKEVVFDAVKAMFLEECTVHNHDVGDALILGAMGRQKLGLPLPFPLLDRHHIALDAVAWPVNLPQGVAP